MTKRSIFPGHTVVPWRMGLPDAVMCGAASHADPKKQLAAGGRLAHQAVAWAGCGRCTHRRGGMNRLAPVARGVCAGGLGLARLAARALAVLPNCARQAVQSCTISVDNFVQKALGNRLKACNGAVFDRLMN